MAATPDPLAPEPLQRRSWPAADLVRRHPPVLRNENKQLLFGIACPPGTQHAGRIDYSRWPELPLARVRPMDQAGIERLASIRDGFYDYEPALPGAGVEWHVNFADPNLFYAYGSALFAQDEIQVAEHPVLGSLREALVADGLPTTTMANGRPTPVLVMGAERRVAVRAAPGAEAGGPSWLYGMAFARATAEHVRDAATPIDPPTISNILAIVAPFGGSGRYRREQIGLALATAYSGFRAAVLESRRTAGPRDTAVEVAIHSGFWGCGAFGGNRPMMVLVQVLAAAMADVNRLVLHVGDPVGRATVEEALSLAPAIADAAAEGDLVAGLEALGLEWGMSDGN